MLHPIYLAVHSRIDLYTTEEVTPSVFADRAENGVLLGVEIIAPCPGDVIAYLLKDVPQQKKDQLFLFAAKHGAFL